MPQRVRVEYRQTFSEDFNSQTVGAQWEFDVPDDTQFQTAFDSGFAVLKTVVDIAAERNNMPGVGGNVQHIEAPVQQQQAAPPPPAAPVAPPPPPPPPAPTQAQPVEDDFDAVQAFGPPPAWVGQPQYQQQTPVQNPRAPQPPAQRQAPPPPPPGRVPRQQGGGRSHQQQGPVPTFADIKEGEPVYYEKCKVFKNEDRTKNKPQRAVRIGKSGPQGLPAESYKPDGTPEQYTWARTFDGAVIADLENIPVQSFINVWGTWRGWSDNETRIQNGEPPMFDLMLEAVELAQ